MKHYFTHIVSTILILTIISFISAPAFAAVNFENVLSDGEWSYTLDSENNAQITKYSGSSPTPSIPETLSGSRVTSIGNAAFYNKEITRVTMPDSVKSIGWWAFYGCKSLKEVSFGSNLKTIGYGAFMNCQSLKAVWLPARICEIGEDAFAVNCSVQNNINDIYSHKKVSKASYTADSEFTVRGFSGTAAEKYALEHSLNFLSCGTLLFGDADLNGSVDKNDTDLIQSFLDNKTDFSDIRLCAADVDGDLSVTSADLSLISQYIQNKISYYDFPSAKGIAPSTDYISGKTMYCDGDSIALGTGTNVFGNSYYSYCNYISQTYNMPMQNRAVAGTTLARQKNKTGDKKSILERVYEMQGSYDVVLLNGGYNDMFQNIKIGEVTPDYDKSGNYNEYTTCGALESICYFLNSNYSDSLKLYVICHKRLDNSNQYKYWGAIKQVLEKWDIPYVDITAETEFYDVNEEITTQYFMFSGSKGDGIHPLEYANRKIYGPCVAKKLNMLASEREKIEFYQSEITMGFLENYTAFLNSSPYIDNENIRWSSDDERVAKTDENGNITAVGTGTAVIRACTSDGKTARLNVNVCFMPVELKLNKLSVTLVGGQRFYLAPLFTNGTASLVKLYTSSDCSVAEVDVYGGVITAKHTGTAVITCHTSNGVRARCTVTVV